MKKTNEQIKTELMHAWKQAIEKSDNSDGVRYRVYLDHDFDFRVLYTRVREAPYCVVEHDSYGVEDTGDVGGVLDMFFDEIMSGIHEDDQTN